LPSPILERHEPAGAFKRVLPPHSNLLGHDWGPDPLKSIRRSPPEMAPFHHPCPPCEPSGPRGQSHAVLDRVEFPCCGKKGLTNSHERSTIAGSASSGSKPLYFACVCQCNPSRIFISVGGVKPPISPRDTKTKYKTTATSGMYRYALLFAVKSFKIRRIS
jgi:hypothetical protein